ncbi:hypothetical protein Tco_0826939 [Tanacetum coccineum]
MITHPQYITGFLEKFEGGFEQDMDDEGEEDKEDEKGDGEVYRVKYQLEVIGRRVNDSEKEARLQNSFPPVGNPIKGLAVPFIFGGRPCFMGAGEDQAITRSNVSKQPTGIWSNGMVPLPSGLDPTWLCGLATPSGLGAM